MKRRLAMSLAVALAVLPALARPAAAQQMFGSKPESKGVSAYIIAPREGVDAVPAGWGVLTDASHANCQLAGEVLEPQRDALPITTTSHELPKADYVVSVCAIGKGRARIKGAAEWVEFEIKGSYYKWAEIGKIPDTDRVSVEVAPDLADLSYAGLLAEGSKMPVIPVRGVLDRMRKGDPVTICLVGDSVTENAKGHRGGSSEFDTGNPGAFRKLIEAEFRTEVAYISHREPPGWPDDGDLAQINTVTVDGTEYRDGRVEVDRSKRIRLINMGKGGAASPDAWRRLPDQFTEPGEWRLMHRGNRQLWTDYRERGAKPILRYGVAHYKPDLVIINFGTNDANGSHVGWTAKDYLFHMKVLATRCQHEFNAAVILATPHLWVRGTHQNPHTQPEMAEAVRAYCAESGFAFADIYREYNVEPGEDSGIHPGNAGHKHIADAYMRALMGRPPAPGPAAGSSAAQFRDNGDGTVTDTKSGLMWTAAGDLADAPKSPTEAAALIDALNKEAKYGHADWRLPTRDELVAVLDPARRKPALPQGHPFKDMKRYYMTGTIGMNLRDADPLTWLVDVDYAVAYFTGTPTRVKSLNKGYVWPVRNAQ